MNQPDDRDLPTPKPDRPAAPVPSFPPEREAVAVIQASMIELSPTGPTVAAVSGFPRFGAWLGGRPLRLLSGRPVIAHLIERVRAARSIRRVVVALSVSPEDDVLIAPIRRAGAQVFRGPVRDLLSRLSGCIDWLGLGDGCPLVRVLLDAPLLDPGYVDAGITALRRLRAAALEFEEDQTEELCPGLSAAFFTAGTLRRVDGLAQGPVQRADVMSYIYENQAQVGLRRVALPGSLHDLRGNHRLLLQTAEDLALHEAIYLRLYHGGPIDTRTALAFLNADPVLASINRGVLQRGMTLPPQSPLGWRAR